MSRDVSKPQYWHRTYLMSTSAPLVSHARTTGSLLYSSSQGQLGQALVMKLSLNPFRWFPAKRPDSNCVCWKHLLRRLMELFKDMMHSRCMNWKSLSLPEQ